MAQELPEDFFGLEPECALIQAGRNFFANFPGKRWIGGKLGGDRYKRSSGGKIAPRFDPIREVKEGKDRQVRLALFE
ncbi:MAG: hypothetical protein IT573_11480 [Deltaproteobacteria bacterium]|nr:hypothetical protein [Deltaproteobacteria bacterium]